MCSKPGRTLGLCLAVVTLASCGFGGPQVEESTHADSAPGTRQASEARAEPWAPTLADVPATTEARETAVTLGASVYAAECATCHGTRGEGEPDWQVTRPDGSLPAPPHDPSGHTWHHPDDELIRIIALGGTVYMENSNMPGFADRLTEREIEAVLAYIKTWWGPEERAYQAEQTWMRQSYTATAESESSD